MGLVAYLDVKHGARETARLAAVNDGPGGLEFHNLTP